MTIQCPECETWFQRPATFNTGCRGPLYLDGGLTLLEEGDNVDLKNIVRDHPPDEPLGIEWDNCTIVALGDTWRGWLGMEKEYLTSG